MADSTEAVSKLDSRSTLQRPQNFRIMGFIPSAFAVVRCSPCTRVASDVTWERGIVILYGRQPTQTLEC